MRNWILPIVLGLFLGASASAQTPADVVQAVKPTNSYQLTIRTGITPAGESATLANRLCIFRVDVTPTQQIVCYSPQSPATTFPENFALQVTMSFTAPLTADPQFRALARNTTFDPVKESELSVNKLVLVWPAPAPPVVQP